MLDVILTLCIPCVSGFGRVAITYYLSNEALDRKVKLNQKCPSVWTRDEKAAKYILGFMHNSWMAITQSRELPKMGVASGQT